MPLFTRRKSFDKITILSHERYRALNHGVFVQQIVMSDSKEIWNIRITGLSRFVWLKKTALMTTRKNKQFHLQTKLSTHSI